jgi:HPr kinase/phosphorylase
VTGADQTLHATCVADGGRALLILGPSGAGKSALALQMMALGARLIADDRTILTLRDGHPVASCPAPLRGLIEARGVGLLRVDPAPPAPVVLAVDLGQAETERLPPPRTMDLLGTKVGLVLGPAGPHLAPALLHLLRGGRMA